MVAAVTARPRAAPGVAERRRAAGGLLAPGKFAGAGIRQSLRHGDGRQHAEVLAQLLLCGSGARRRGERGQAAGRPMAASFVCFRGRGQWLRGLAAANRGGSQRSCVVQTLFHCPCLLLPLYWPPARAAQQPPPRRRGPPRHSLPPRHSRPPSQAPVRPRTAAQRHRATPSISVLWPTAPRPATACASSLSRSRSRLTLSARRPR